MSQKIPTEIREVICFPLNALENPEHLENLGYLCPFKDEDKLEAVHATFLGAWRSLKRKCEECSISNLIAKARKQNPCYIRPESQRELDPECAAVLAKIPNFAFSVEGGFFRWSYNGGLDQGVFSQNTLSEKFAKFERYVMDKKPSTFDAIEGALL